MLRDGLLRAGGAFCVVLRHRQAASGRRCFLCWGTGCFGQEVHVVLRHGLLRAGGAFCVEVRAASGRR